MNPDDSTEIPYNPGYHKAQLEIFLDDTRFKIIAKGRRFGLTRGMAKYVIEMMLARESPVLWVDTIYSNIKL